MHQLMERLAAEAVVPKELLDHMQMVEAQEAAAHQLHLFHQVQ